MSVLVLGNMACAICHLDEKKVILLQSYCNNSRMWECLRFRTWYDWQTLDITEICLLHVCVLLACGFITEWFGSCHWFKPYLFTQYSQPLMLTSKFTNVSCHMIQIISWLLSAYTQVSLNSVSTQSAKQQFV